MPEQVVVRFLAVLKDVGGIVEILCCSYLSGCKQHSHFRPPHLIAFIDIWPIRSYMAVASSVTLIVKKELMNICGYKRGRIVLGRGYLSECYRDLI